MEISKVLFACFAAMTVLPVVYLIFTRNIIRAAFAVVISLLGVAALYVMLHAELMAVVQIMIYAGGVIVLLLFGIMLTRRGSERGVFTGHRNELVGALTAVLLCVLLIKLILKARWTVVEIKEDIYVPDQVRFIGMQFLTRHVLSFELVAFVLLVALVAAAYLAKKSSKF